MSGQQPYAAPLPQVLARLLGRADRRRRQVAAGTAFGWACVAAAACAMSASGLDLLGDPWPGLRHACAWAVWLALAAGLAIALRRIGRRADAVHTARHLEQVHGLAGEPMSAAVGLCRSGIQSGISPWMTARTVAQAAVVAAGLDHRAAVPLRALRRAWLLALAILAIVLLAASSPVGSAAVARAWLPWRDLPRPGAELLLVEPGDAWVAPGGSVDITAAGAMELTCSLTWDDGRTEERPLIQVGARRVLHLADLVSGCVYRVHGTGLESPEHRLHLASVPEVAAVRLRVQPPAYTRLPERSVSGGDADLLAGSQVQAEFDLAGPPAAAAALVGPGGEIPLTISDRADGQQATGTITARTDTTWRLRLVVAAGAGGLSTEAASTWRWRVSPDRPPSVTILPGQPGAAAAPGDILWFEVLAEDDVGLSTLAVEIICAGRPPLRLPLDLPAQAGRHARAAVAVVPAALGVQVGDELSVVPLAQDRGGTEVRGAAANVGVRDPGQAAALAAAARLRSAEARLARLDEQLADLSTGWRGLARGWLADDPAASTGAITALAARSRAWSGEATVIGGEFARSGFAPGTIIGHRLAELVVEQGAALAAAAATAAAGDLAGATAGRDAAAELAAGLASLRSATAVVRGAAEGAALAARANAAHARLGRAAGTLRGVHAWALAAPAETERGGLAVLMAGASPDLADAAGRLASAAQAESSAVATDLGVLAGALPGHGLRDLIAGLLASEPPPGSPAAWADPQLRTAEDQAGRVAGLAQRVRDVLLHAAVEAVAAGDDAKRTSARHGPVAVAEPFPEGVDANRAWERLLEAGRGLMDTTATRLATALHEADGGLSGLGERLDAAGRPDLAAIARALAVEARTTASGDPAAHATALAAHLRTRLGEPLALASLQPGAPPALREAGIGAAGLATTLDAAAADLRLLISGRTGLQGLAAGGGNGESGSPPEPEVVIPTPSSAPAATDIHDAGWAEAAEARGRAAMALDDFPVECRAAIRAYFRRLEEGR